MSTVEVELTDGMWLAIEREYGHLRGRWSAALMSVDDGLVLCCRVNAESKKEARIKGANAVAAKLRQWADDISQRVPS